MPPMRTPLRTFIERHHPLITPRIQFRIKSRAPLPKLTGRTHFELVTPPRAPTPNPQPQEDDPLDREESPSPPPAPIRHLQRQDVSSPPPMPGPSGTSSIIEKPGGEPGRPHSGGFNLEAKLMEHNWSKDDVENLMAYLRKEAPKTLDVSISYRSQKPERITQICDKAMEAGNFPSLSNYEGCWPVRSALKLILKYASEAARRADTKNIAAKMRDVVAGKRRAGSDEL